MYGRYAGEGHIRSSLPKLHKFHAIPGQHFSPIFPQLPEEQHAARVGVPRKCIEPTWILRSTVRAAVIPHDRLEEVLQYALVPSLLSLVDD